MGHREYGIVSGSLFAAVAAAHMLRIVYGVPVDVAGTAVPMSVSWVGFVVPAALSAWAFRLLRRGAA